MRFKKIALLLVPALLALVCASVPCAGTIVAYIYDADGNIKDVITSSATTVQLTADPPYIQPGGTATLSWASINATSY